LPVVADDELRSVNAQFLLLRALRQAGRPPRSRT